jgi:hypothetical protein
MIIGFDPLSAEISKNIVLSGVKRYIYYLFNKRNKIILIKHFLIDTLSMIDIN